ncbi:hypothetical protein [Botrimarina sp.]|uniref:hypothetical protein n=1 Tax=Botrimarina sp. TaxID=2795802 RepID=UPI0032ED8D38
MPIVLGIDVGLVLHRPTSGVCLSGEGRFAVGHACADKLSRAAVIGPVERVDVVAIDGPVLPRGSLHFGVRPVEKVFCWKPFIGRASVGETRHGIGAALRRGGCDTAEQFGELTSGSPCATPYPRVQQGRHLVEAFPNALLGLMLPEADFDEQPKHRRGGRFDWLLRAWRERRGDKRLRRAIGWDDAALWREIGSNTHHEEQAGLLCAATAACVVQNRYTAVGEPQGGYLFFPPWELWAPWAKEGLGRNRDDPRLPRPVDVWIDGERFAAAEPLPR